MENTNKFYGEPIKESKYSQFSLVNLKEHKIKTTRRTNQLSIWALNNNKGNNKDSKKNSLILPDKEDISIDQ
jgi:hypothetical protein